MRTTGACFTLLLCASLAAMGADAGPKKAPTRPRASESGPSRPTPVVPVPVVNLELAEDGGLGVAAPATREPVVLELLDEPLFVPPFGEAIVPTIVDAKGYSSIGYHVVSDSGVTLTTEWRWSEDEVFATVSDQRIAPGSCTHTTMATDTRLMCPVAGAQVQLRISQNQSTERTIDSVRVYLIP